MRCWSLEDGRLLVEEKEGEFLLFRGERFERLYFSGSHASQEYLHTSLYAVVDGELRLVFSAENADSGRVDHSRSVELRGLVEAPAEKPEARVRAWREAQAAASAEAARRESERLASFERALPPPSGPMDFVFAYDGPDIVIRGPGSGEVWREREGPRHGKARFAELKKSLRRRYGKKLRSFKAELPDIDAGLRFNPD